MESITEVTLSIEEFQLIHKALWETTHCTETDLDAQKDLFALQDQALAVADDVAENLSLSHPKED